MDQDALQEELWRIVEPVVSDLGLELWDVRFSGGRDGRLAVYVDDPDDGVKLAQCVAVSRRLGVVLDVEDPIRTRYSLEVSSPGLDRSLRRMEHFERHLGEAVRAELREPLDGRRKLTGTIEGVDEESLHIDVEGLGCVSVPRLEIKKANLVPPPPPFGAPNSQREKGRHKTAGRKE